VSLFHVLRARTHFRRYRGRRLPFTSFARLDSFSTVPRASGPVFKLCAPGLVFGGTEGVLSCFHVLRARTRIRRYRGCPVPFSCFTRSTYFRRYRGRRLSFSFFLRSNSLSAVPRLSAPVFMFCAPGLIFDGTEGVAPVFMFCSPIIIFGDTEGVRSRFQALRTRTRFRRYRGRRVPFSCFAYPESFSAVPRASAPFFMFCASGLIFGGTVGVGSRRFHVLRAQTHFQRYRGRRLPVSCFARPNSFSAVPRAS
jgi:hypothetical protein